MGTLAQANECTNPTSGDWFWIHDVSAGATDRDRRVDVGRFPQLAATNTFTADQIIAGNLSCSVYDNTTGTGRAIVIDRNNNGSTPAPGALTLREADGDSASIYADSSMILRVRSGAGPTSGQISGGTVVGAQTSSLDAKNVLGEPEITGLWDRIALGAASVRRFVYKSGAFDGEEFSGVVIDYAPHYGMDRDADHPAGKALNEINVMGDLLLAVSQLNERVAALEI